MPSKRAEPSQAGPHIRRHDSVRRGPPLFLSLRYRPNRAYISERAERRCDCSGVHECIKDTYTYSLGTASHEGVFIRGDIGVSLRVSPFFVYFASEFLSRVRCI